MARVKGGHASIKRHKRVLKSAKGYFGSKHLLYKTAHEQVVQFQMQLLFRDHFLCIQLFFLDL